MYTITAAGEEFLSAWVDTIAGYQRLMSSFFELYSKFAGPLTPGTRPEGMSDFYGKAQNSQEDKGKQKGDTNG